MATTAATSTKKKSKLELGNTKSLESFGTFTAPDFITIGDPYAKKEVKDSRLKNPQFKIQPLKSGKVGTSVTFDKFKPLFESEKWVTPKPFERSSGLSASTLKNKKDGTKQNEKPFLPTSPPKKPSGLGSNFGVIGPPPKYESDHPHTKDEPVKKIEESKDKGKKVFMPTSPPKQGTYGFVKTTIGAEPKYEGDPYDTMRKKHLEEKKTQDSKIIGKEPFKSTTKTKDFFDTQNNVPASTVYSMDKKAQELVEKRKALEVKKKEEQDKKKKDKDLKPFKPTSPPKRGYNCTINKFPEYKNEPYDAKSKPGKKDETQKETKPIWKPISVPHSTPMASILFKNM